MQFAVAVVPTTGQDRAAVFVRGEGLVIVLADGAGGTAGGAAAASAIVEGVGAASGEAWGDLLGELDADPRRLGFGQATAVVLSLDPRGIRGASVGDSGAWLIRADDVDDLTQAQQRKPLVGSGGSPVPFRTGPVGDGTLLVASDGLLHYAKQAAIAAIARGPDLEVAARQLVELVRLASGALPDDVSIVLCRATR